MKQIQLKHYAMKYFSKHRPATGSWVKKYLDKTKTKAQLNAALGEAKQVVLA